MRTPNELPMQHPEPRSRDEWRAAYKAKHRDYKGKTEDGRRSMLWNGCAAGTVLLIEPTWCRCGHLPHATQCPAPDGHGCWCDTFTAPAVGSLL